MDLSLLLSHIDIVQKPANLGAGAPGGHFGVLFVGLSGLNQKYLKHF